MFWMFSVLSVFASFVAPFVCAFLGSLVIPSATALAQVQPPAVEWEKTFGGASWDEGRSVKQTTDGGYTVVGWTASFGAGGPDVYLIKIDASGNLAWQKTFGSATNDYGNSIQQTPDGGYIITGSTDLAGGPQLWSDVYLIKTDGSGLSIWQKTYGGENHDWGNSILQNSDGGYIIVGGTYSFGAVGDDAYLVRTNFRGDLLWQKKYGGAGQDTGSTVLQTSDGGYIIGGYTTSFAGGGTYLMKINNIGDLTWRSMLGDGGCSMIQQTSDGEYILVGWTWVLGAGGGDVNLIKTDTQGKLVWQKTVGGSKWEMGYSIQQTTDGGYVVAGETESLGAGKKDVYVFKTDNQGNLIWQTTFGGTVHDGSQSIQQTKDGGYIVSGWTESFGAGDRDVYLIKLAPEKPAFPDCNKNGIDDAKDITLGTSQDCNANKIPDECDITSGTSKDANVNGIPDECDPLPCSQDAEFYDEMDSELAHNIEVFGLGRVCAADLTGVIGVKRYLPYVDPTTGRRTIETKITKLELTGTDPNCGEIKITLQPERASNGKVVEQKAGTCFPADSYFDVYIRVEIPALNLTFANCEPAKMRCVVTTLPPIGCVYQIGMRFDVPLYDAAKMDCANAGNPVGKIIAADHTPTKEISTSPVPPSPTERTQLNIYAVSQNEWLPLTELVRKDHFKPDLPVIVIVHGWNIYVLDTLDAWENELASTLLVRKPGGYNVLAWDWMEEAKGGAKIRNDPLGLHNAASHIWDQSVKLSRSLQQLFKVSGFAGNPIHLMGHSLGGFVVTFSSLQLQDPAFGGGIYPIANVTLWDPPSAVPNSLSNNVPILRSLGTVVDIVSGLFNSQTHFSTAWIVSPDSILVEGLGHDTFRWYQNHALPNTEPTLHQRLACDDAPLPTTVGFGASRAHAPAERQLRFGCQENELDVSLVGYSEKETCTLTDAFVYAQFCISEAQTPTPVMTAALDNGISGVLCDCAVPPDLLSLRMRLRKSGGGGMATAGAGQAELLTATYTLPQMIADAWDYAQFTYRFAAAPGATTFTVAVDNGIETVPVFLTTSETALGEGDVLSPLIALTPYRGKEVSLIFSVASEQPNAIVEISNLTYLTDAFHNNVAPVADAGKNRAVAATGATTPVTLDASGSRDSNNDPLTFLWTLPGETDPKQQGIAAVGQTPTMELPLGGYEFTLYVRDPFDGVAEPKTVLVEVEYPFIRGDSNNNGKLDITDPINTLTRLFLNASTPLCVDAADTDDSNAVDVSDAISLLGFLFLGSAHPAAPFPGLGLDPTPDVLGCDLAHR